MSRCLAERSIDHVVLERGEVANSWRTERWDSLRLLTPNWQSRLPGFGYEGDDPDGYRTVPEVVAFIDRYARVIAAPVRTRMAVTAVRCTDDGYAVEADSDIWSCRTVVLATGACNIPDVPSLAAALPPSALMSLTTTLAPSAASRAAIALPMPCAAPVTSAVLPESLPVIVFPLGVP